MSFMQAKAHALGVRARLCGEGKNSNPFAKIIPQYKLVYGNPGLSLHDAWMAGYLEGA